MKPNLTAIPQGTRTYLSGEAALKRRLEQEILSVLGGRGFQEIVTPLIDYFDSASAGLTEDERNRVIRFSEGDTGKILAMRPDITSQIARSAATHLSGRPHPLKLCYSGPVFRMTHKGKGEQYVLNQSGMEIIGQADAEADHEVISSITAIMGKVGLKGFAFSVGHAGVIGSLMKGIAPQYAEKIKSALAKKDRPALAQYLEQAGAEKKTAEKIVALAGLFGGKEVLKEAVALCGDEGTARPALDNLAAIVNALEPSGNRITVDLGEMRGFGYYTGIIMELFSATGLALGNGGRYDTLVQRYGANLPAVGFAFDVDRLMEAVMKEIPEGK